jgi:hypothetical protein
MDTSHFPYYSWKQLVMGDIFSAQFCVVIWGSSVSIVSDYRLDHRGPILGRGKEFFL